MSELATDYLDGALPWRVRLRARVHLLMCRACSAYYDQMRRVIQLLAGGPREAPPQAVEDRILDALGHGHGGPGHRDG